MMLGVIFKIDLSFWDTITWFYKLYLPNMMDYMYEYCLVQEYFMNE